MWGEVITGVICFALGYGVRIIVVDIRATRRPQKPIAYKIESTCGATIGDALEAKKPGLPARMREKVRG